MTNQIVSLFNEVLGSSRKTSKGNYAYECPFPKCTSKGKKKLELHPTKQVWHCWVCGSKGAKLMSLLKRMKADKIYLTQLAKYLPDEKYKFLLETPEESTTKKISLPADFEPLWKPQSNFLYTRAMDYLIATRGLTKYDIYKYRLGYCTTGKYKGMIIIPNYDKAGSLNYFTTRRFFGNPSEKFRNPPTGRGVVGFELQLNWNLPLILVESGLDAITLRRNASPLYGSELTDAVTQAIFLNDVRDLKIVLDPDALSKAIKYSKFLSGYDINVSLVELPGNSDVNELGFKGSWDKIYKTETSSSFDLFEKELRLKLL